MTILSHVYSGHTPIGGCKKSRTKTASDLLHRYRLCCGYHAAMPPKTQRSPAARDDVTRRRPGQGWLRAY